MNKKNIILKAIFIIVAIYLTVMLTGSVYYFIYSNISAKMGYFNFILDYTYTFFKFVGLILLSSSIMGVSFLGFYKLYEKIFK